jgi:hypothetical protein
VLSVISPTCDNCRGGLRLVRDVVDGHPAVVLFVLWIGMLSGDSASAAARAAAESGGDTDARHYWEEEGWPVSTRLRSILGIGSYDPTRSAWDVYLLYPRGVRWAGDDPPVPSGWAYNVPADLPVGERLNAALLHRWMLYCGVWYGPLFGGDALDPLGEAIGDRLIAHRYIRHPAKVPRRFVVLRHVQRGNDRKLLHERNSLGTTVWTPCNASSGSRRRPAPIARCALPRPATAPRQNGSRSSRQVCDPRLSCHPR